jgi:hypothetical protein
MEKNKYEKTFFAMSTGKIKWIYVWPDNLSFYWGRFNVIKKKTKRWTDLKSFLNSDDKAVQ